MSAVQAAKPPSRQHWKTPPDFVRQAVAAGIPVTSLRTLARFGVLAAGHQSGILLRTATLSDRVGRSRRSVQRDLAAIEAAEVPGVRIMRDRPAGQYRMSWPNRYTVPTAPRGEPGSIVWAEYLNRPTYLEATPSQQGLWIVLQTLIPADGRQLAARELAEAAGVGLTCARGALRYFARAGWLEVEERRRPDGGAAANHYRIRTPWELRGEEAVTDPEAARAHRRRGLMVRWIGLIAARGTRLSDGPGWPDVIGAVSGSDERETEVARRFAARLARLTEKGRYKGASGVALVRDCLRPALDRREEFDDEITELARDPVAFDAKFGISREMDRDVWHTFHEALRGAVIDGAGIQQWNIWFSHFSPGVSSPAGVVSVTVPNRYLREYISDNFGGPLHTALTAASCDRLSWVVLQEDED